MMKYSLVLLAASAVLFTGCGDGECCQPPLNPPVASIAEANNQTIVAGSALTFTGAASSDSDGTVQGYRWSVNGTEVSSGDGAVEPLNYTFPTAGSYEVCLSVTDNDNLNSTNKECRTVVVTAAPAVNQKPVARITEFPTTCDAGDTLNVSGTTSSDDSAVSSYTWTPASIGTGASGTITCPASGSMEVCLTVTDNGTPPLDSDRVCKSVTVNAPLTLPPIARLSATGNIANGFDINCTEIRDQDTIDTDGVVNPYGTDSAIKEIHWDVFYADGTSTDWNQTAFNTLNSWTAGTCGKWIYGNRGDAILTSVQITPVDDEDDNQTYIYDLNVSTGEFTLRE